MPSFDQYRKMYGNITPGQAHKIQSDQIMENTWYRDIATRTAYFYDLSHDNYKTKLNDLDSANDENKIPMDIKYLVNSAQTLDKDSVSYHLQMKPSQECVVPYYKELFEDRYSAKYPCGLYVDIPDSKGKYNKWLVVATANVNDPQFPTFELLRCDYVLQYIFDGIKYQYSIVLRSQNSYNSGVWADYKMESVEDQQKFLIPLDRNTEKLFYNQRLIIDNRVLSQPRAWRITKVNRVGYNGLAMITCAQDIFDEHKDYIELDNNGNVIGMWADYYSSSISPKDNEESKSDTIYSKISYSGLKPEIKIAGSYKKFTVNFYDKDVEIPFKQGNWYIYDGDIDVSNLFDIKTDPDILNQIKIKFLGDLSYKGNVYSIKYISNDGIETSEDIEIQTL